MSFLPDVARGELGLVIGPRAKKTQMLALSAMLALRGPVRVLDGGNSYNALTVARTIRRHTARLDAVLNRIYVARAFTCYQVVTLLEQTAVSPAPTLVLDLLATFGDESIDLGESVRLLRLVVVQLQRLCRCAPVVVSLRPFPAHQPERAVLIELVKAAASHHFEREAAETTVHQPSLFSHKK